MILDVFHRQVFPQLHSKIFLLLHSAFCFFLNLYCKSILMNPFAQYYCNNFTIDRIKCLYQSINRYHWKVFTMFVCPQCLRICSSCSRAMAITKSAFQGSPLLSLHFGTFMTGLYDCFVNSLSSAHQWSQAFQKDWSQIGVQVILTHH